VYRAFQAKGSSHFLGGGFGDSGEAESPISSISKCHNSRTDAVEKEPNYGLTRVLGGDFVSRLGFEFYRHARDSSTRFWGSLCEGEGELRVAAQGRPVAAGGCNFSGRKLLTGAG
jgi:hypothetical protein